MEQPNANVDHNTSNFKDIHKIVGKDPLTERTGYRKESNSSSSTTSPSSSFSDIFLLAVGKSSSSSSYVVFKVVANM